MNHNLPFEVVGAANRSLIVLLDDGRTAFISNKKYVALLRDPKLNWRVAVYPAHQRFNPKTNKVVEYPSTNWIEVATFSRF